MAASTDYYDVLELGREADTREIKRAFFRLLKEHPPEQKPEEYRRLREAYDTLSDPASRTEYDSMSQFGEEIGALKEQAVAMMDADPPDVAGAIRNLKKAIVLAPEIGYLRNMLGLCLLENEQPGKAITQFERAHRISPDNLAFLINSGIAKEAHGLFKAAETTLRKAWERDKEDYAAPRALASLLRDRERTQEAHAVLDEAIGADGKVDFQDFFCLWDKMHFHLFDAEHDKLSDILTTIERVAKSEADKQYAAFMLARVADSLFDLKVWDKANEFMQSASRLLPSDADLQSFAKNVEEVSGVESSLTAVMEDESYHFIIAEMVRWRSGIYLDYVDEEEGKEQYLKVLEVADTVMQADPDATKAKNSALKLRREHPPVADLLSDVLDVLLDAPRPRLFRAPCPHCGDHVIVEKHDTGQVSCPHCYRDFNFDGNKYKKRGEYKKQANSVSTYNNQSVRHDADSSGCMVTLLMIASASSALVYGLFATLRGFLF